MHARVACQLLFFIVASALIVPPQASFPARAFRAKHGWR
jgi:hypothetical protein